MREAHRAHLFCRRRGCPRSSIPPLRPSPARCPARAPAPGTDHTTIRPFEIHITEEQLADLRSRLAATRWPTRELVDDRSQGVRLATAEAPCRYWAGEYEGRRVEARLNALPLIMTHGWPGSVIELLDVVGPLTDPTAHGGSAEDAFERLAEIVRRG